MIVHFLTVKIRPVTFLPQHGFSRLRHGTETPLVSQEEAVWNKRLLKTRPQPRNVRTSEATQPNLLCTSE